MLTRLRFGTCRLTRDHILARTEAAKCNICHCRQTVQHILLDCPKYDQERGELFRAAAALGEPLSMQLLLSERYPTTVLLEYLSSTNLAASINLAA